MSRPAVSPVCQLRQLVGLGDGVDDLVGEAVDVVIAVLTGDRSELPDLYETYERLSSSSDTSPAKHFQLATEALLLAYNDVQHDAVGAVYEQLELQNEHTCQCFTVTVDSSVADPLTFGRPYDVFESELTAAETLALSTNDLPGVLANADRPAS